MTKFRDLRGRSRARRFAADRTSRAGSPRPRSRNCLAYGNFLSSGMRRSRTAAIGMTHALTPLLTRTLKGLQSSFASIHTLPHAAKAANRGILRRETLLVSVIVTSPHHRLRRSFSRGRRQTLPPLRDTSPKTSFQGRLLLLLSITGKGFTCYAFSAPICAGALWGKSELTRAKLKALKNRVKRGESMRYADSRGATSAHART